MNGYFPYGYIIAESASHVTNDEITQISEIYY